MYFLSPTKVKGKRLPLSVTESCTGNPAHQNLNPVPNTDGPRQRGASAPPPTISEVPGPLCSLKQMGRQASSVHKWGTIRIHHLYSKQPSQFGSLVYYEKEGIPLSSSPSIKPHTPCFCSSLMHLRRSSDVELLSKLRKHSPPHTPL